MSQASSESGIEEEEDVEEVTVVVLSSMIVGVGGRGSVSGSLSGDEGALFIGEGAILSSSSLVEGPRTSMEESLSLSDLDDSLDEENLGHFRYGCAIGRSVGRGESSEDVELIGGGLPRGVLIEKFRCGTVMLETSGVSGESG